METKFQTSFIPKRPLLNDERTHVKKAGNLFMFISMLIFIASIAGAAFVVLWGIVLTRTQVEYKTQLANTEKLLRVDLIEKLKKANTKIDLSLQLLKNHLAVSEVFNALSQLTIQGIRFTSFTFTTPSEKDSQTTGIKISMKGIGRNFSSLAFQAQVFGESDQYGLRDVIKNPIVSDLAVDDKGDVTFLFTGTVDPNDISYTNLLNGGTSQ